MFIRDGADSPFRTDASAHFGGLHTLVILCSDRAEDRNSSTSGIYSVNDGRILSTSDLHGMFWLEVPVCMQCRQSTTMNCAGKTTIKIHAPNKINASKQCSFLVNRA